MRERAHTRALHRTKTETENARTQEERCIAQTREQTNCDKSESESVWCWWILWCACLCRAAVPHLFSRLQIQYLASKEEEEEEEEAEAAAAAEEEEEAAVAVVVVETGIHRRRRV